jgi:hypothetical protein
MISLAGQLLLLRRNWDLPCVSLNELRIQRSAIGDHQ